MSRSARAVWISSLLVGALLSSACDDVDSAPVRVNATQRTMIYNEIIDACLAVRTGSSTIAAAPCAEGDPYVQWRISEVEPGLFAIRLEPDPSLCLTLLVPEAGDIPVVGPCDEKDFAAVGQLFRITKNRISDSSNIVYLTALGPRSVAMMPLGQPDDARQRWQLR